MEAKKVENDELEFRINKLRKMMIEVAEETGFNSDDTLYYSRKLDDLIMMYQKQKMNKTD